MYWLWKWLESYNNCTFSTWKDKFLFNLLFWIPNSFCAFHDYGREGTHFLAFPDGPSVIFYYADFWTTFLPWKTELPCNFSLCWNIFDCVEIFFTEIFLSFRTFEQLVLALKTECALNSLYLIYIINHSEFWTTCACPEKQSLPWSFHCVEIFFIFQDFWTTWACPENRVCHEIFDCYLIYFLHSGCLSNFCLPWKTECALNSLYLICIFIIQNFQQVALALKNRICPEIFHCIEIFLSFRIFEQLELALKTEFALNFSSHGGGLVRHWFLAILITP